MDTTGLSRDVFDPRIKKNLQMRAITTLDRLKMENDHLNRQEARDERRYLRGEALNEKRERNLDQDIQKLSKDVAGTQDLLGALDEVEGKLGGSIDTFSKDASGNLVRGGKKVDLPGVSIPGIGRVSAYSEDARGLRDAASRVFNATLKDRSGGAVTDNELERLKTEFSEGKFNTEPELISALQRYKRQVQTVLKNREAAYKPEAVARYTEQGGRTSQTIKSPSPPPSDFVLMKDPKGNLRQIPKDQAQAAQAAGGTLVDTAVAGGR
jgi:hypothetical protein